MFVDFPIKKIFWFALITSPLFGLFGSSPGFMASNISLNRIAELFFVVTGFAIYLWTVNILLAYASIRATGLRHNAIRFITSSLICIISAWIVFILIRHNMPPRPRHFPVEFKGLPRPSEARMTMLPILQSLSFNLIIFILLELIILRETKNKVALENEQLKLANSEARNNQLKQQLHPHFLFNSLTTLRSLINRSPEQASDYLEKLSDLLRFSTTNSQHALVLLKEEVELCTNYLNMQKVRFGDALSFTIDVAETLRQHGRVPVYSLQSLAENAIKHNILTKEQPLFIEITAKENNDLILIRNNLQPKQTIEGSNGVGLANLSERYRLLAGTDIDIKNENGCFAVRIKILKDGGNNN